MHQPTLQQQVSKHNISVHGFRSERWWVFRNHHGKNLLLVFFLHGLALQALTKRYQQPETC